jgi:di/tricarboxylate transporter
VTDQVIVFVALAAALVLFVGGWWRYDVVALVVLVAMVVLGVVPANEAFLGFGNPAVITVAAVLVVSQALMHAGVVDAISIRLERVGERPAAQVAALTVTVTVLSAFMNNVGALALLLPVAVRMARRAGTSPSILLMPLAFGSLLGGLITMVGTPPNIIVATARAGLTGESFGLFAFAPVGGGVALAGVACIGAGAWRLIPQRQSQRSRDELFDIDDYLAEVRVPEGSPLAGAALGRFLDETDHDVTVVGVVRDGERRRAPSIYEILRPGDILLVSAGSEDLDGLIAGAGLEVVGSDAFEAGTDDLEGGEIGVLEAIIGPGSVLAGRTAAGLALRQRYRMNVVAVARRGRGLRERLGHIRFEVGDILLVQGPSERLPSVLAELGCLPLAERTLRIGQPRRIVLAAAIFAVAVVAAAFGLVDVSVAFVAAAVGMVVARLLPLDEMYRAIDWPVIVLLGAMLPVGAALETSGGADVIASALLDVARDAAPWVAVATLMVVAMALSNVINNAAAVVLMIPIAAGTAAGLGVSVDPLLMAVAVGASTPFLTPIGHQSSALVMSPGGYRFGDYWRLGLPLSAVVVAVAVPLILVVWPL